jgi:uncharacterized membrane protein YvbJ
VIDEGPSPEDLERFGDDATGYCPACGEEIWDDVEQCPKCHAYIGGASSRRPDEAAARRKIYAIIAVVTIIGFLALVGALRLF